MNRPALFLVILAGALTGMLPYAAFLDSVMFAGAYASGSLLVALALAIRHAPAQNEPPRIGEHIHAVLGGAAYSAAMAYMGFLLYAVAYALTYAVGFVGDWLQLGWRVNPGLVARWVSASMTLLVGLFTLSFSPVPRTLYPDVAGVVSAYDGLLRRRILSWSVPLCLGGILLAGLTYWLWPGEWWGYVIAGFMIVGSGGESLNVASDWSPTVALGKEAVEAVEKLYGILGYNTILSPRTKESDADLDSLLQRVDMFAVKEAEALAIELKTPQRTNRAVSAADASILPVAARAISRYISEDVTSPVHVRPVLVLVGREQTADLARLADEEQIKVLPFTEDAVRKVLQTEDKNLLRQWAQQYLRVDAATMSGQNAPTTAASAAP